MAPDGSYAVIGTNQGRVVLLPLDGGPVKQLGSFSGSAWNADIGPRSRLIAVGFDDLTVRVWDLSSGEVRVLAPDCVLTLVLWEDAVGSMG